MVRIVRIFALALVPILAIACGGTAPTPTATAIVDDAREALADLDSFAVREVVNSQECPVGGPVAPTFHQMIIDAEWSSPGRYQATIKPPCVDNSIEVIAADGETHARWEGQAFDGSTHTSLSDRDWDELPSLRDLGYQGTTTVQDIDAHHITATLDVATTTNDGYQTGPATLDLYIDSSTNRLLEYRSRTPHTPVADGETFVTDKLRTYSRFNEDFDITAPEVPAPTAVPPATPTPTP